MTSSSSPREAGFRLCHRILTRFGETDMQGVIFNARYLDYADLAISVYWARAGIKLFGADMLGFHVANANIDFLAPMRAFEHIDLMCRTEKIGRTSVTTLIELHGAESPFGEDQRAAIRIVHVCVDHASHRPTPLPQAVSELLMAFDARDDVVMSGDRN